MTLPFAQYYITDTDPALLGRFDCDSPRTNMNEFLRDEALNYHNDGHAVTRVFVDEANGDIIGYYTLKCSCLQMLVINEFSGKQEVEVVPAVELARFAVDRRYQGQACPYYQGRKYSEFVFDHVMDDVVNIRELFAGVAAVILFSVDEERPRRFYRSLDFKEIPGDDTISVYHSTENDRCIAMYKSI